MIDYSLHTVRPRLHGLFLLSCALAAPIMVCAKLEGANMPWGATFIPIWLFVLAYVLLVFPCCHVWEDSSMNKLLLLTWVRWCCMVFLLFPCVKFALLPGSGVSWRHFLGPHHCQAAWALHFTQQCFCSDLGRDCVRGTDQSCLLSFVAER